MIAVLLHEWGHFYAAYRFGYVIEKIELMPFGGVVKLQEYGNRPFHQEWIVLIAGPVQHVWVIAIFYFFPDVFPYSDVQIMIHLSLLCFNLLPIYPLDGGKMMLLLFASRKPYHRAFEQTLRVSLIHLFCLTGIVLFVVPKQLNFWMMILFLLGSVWLDWKKRFVLFQMFLLERYQMPNVRRKRKLIMYQTNVSTYERLKWLYKDRFCEYQQRKQKEIINEKKLLHDYFIRKEQ